MIAVVFVGFRFGFVSSALADGAGYGFFSSVKIFGVIWVFRWNGLRRNNGRSVTCFGGFVRDDVKFVTRVLFWGK